MESSSYPGKAPRLRIVDVLVAPFFALAFLCLLIAFDVLQRIAFLHSQDAQQKAVLSLNRCLVFLLKAVGTRFVIKGSPPAQCNKPIVIVANHQSLFDIPLIGVLFSKYNPRYVAKKELARWIPSISFNLSKGGHALIDRSDPKQAVDAIKDLAVLAKNKGFAFLLFPEGTRARDGVLKKFRFLGIGAVVESLDDAVFVPVAIDGMWRLSYRKAFVIPVGSRVEVRIGEPLDMKDFKSARPLVIELHRRISCELAQMRGA